MWTILIHIWSDIPTWVRVNGSALKQDSGSPVGQGPIDTVTVTCNPANICHTAEHIPIMVAEHILVKGGKIDGTGGILSFLLHNPKQPIWSQMSSLKENAGIFLILGIMFTVDVWMFHAYQMFWNWSSK